MDLASPWLFLALGLLFMLPPMPIFYAEKIKFRSIEYLEIARRNGSWWKVLRNVVTLPGHWIELGRAYVGMRCLLYSLETIRGRGTYPDFSKPWMVAAMALGAATLALLLMLVAFRRSEGALAPVTFVFGAILAAMPVEIGSLALILAVATMVSFKSLGAFFGMLALGLMGLGYLFGQLLIAGMFGAGFAAIPLLFAFFMNRELVIPIRQSRSKRSVEPAR